jgi:peptide/nickel transport system permease protein
VTDLSVAPATDQAAEADVATATRAGPYWLAWRRLRRNRIALCAGFVFLLVVGACLAAPLYARYVAHTGPNTNHVLEQITVDGKSVDVVSPIGIPIGPTWHARFLLGADPNGRDVAVRLLYGGRTSLGIGALATLITLTFGALLGVLSGYYGGFVDSIISRALEILWAFPAVLLAVALGVTLELSNINLWVLRLHSGSLLVPPFIIGVVYIPYAARPLRAEVLRMRREEFVLAARVAGLSDPAIMLREIVINVLPLILVLAPLILANAILLEAGLSFLGAGVQPPNASWGTEMALGIQLIPGAFHLVIVPGLMLVVAVLSINIFGDGVRDALDPRLSVRIGRS